MPDEELFLQLRDLENDNVRLHHLLNQKGATTGLRLETRNTLAIVRAIMRRTADTSGDSVENYVAHLESRIDAVCRIQNTVANCPHDSISIYSLVADELMVHAIGRRDRLSFEGPDVLLLSAAASPLALAIHELATNAVKFGALTGSEGRLAVSWWVGAGEDGQPWLALEWVESGMTIPGSRTRRGFGSEVVERMIPYLLGGRGSLDLTPAGMRCTLGVPLTPGLGSVRAPLDPDRPINGASML